MFPLRRRLHSTLVGPPDPVSNLRQVIYRPLKQHTETHPYLVEEFSAQPEDFQWNIARGRVDAFNHSFWTENNTRFHAERNRVLASIAAPRTAEQTEAALTRFYNNWAAQEQFNLREYNKAWSRANYRLIRLAFSRQIASWIDYIARLTRVDH